MLLLKIKSLSYGHSGIQLETVNRLIDFYNNDILPVIFTQGSLGASGDLAPLAHLALPLIGEGMVWYNGAQVTAAEVLNSYDWKPITLKSKEGLALLNGTQFMTAYGIHVLLKSFKLSYIADLVGALSLDAYDGRIEPFDALVHLVRPHNGQIKTANRILGFLEGSELMKQPKKHVQDPYSFRCMPQVHGATKDTLMFVRNTFITEINAVTDNPNIFTKDDKIISGGNFHGQPLAFGFDFLKIAMAELGNISERRTYQLVSGLRGLPSFLVEKSGLNSGLMIPQYTAASIVSANKQLATPASVDSIVSSNGQEDHVSMGANAAIQAYQIIENVERILAIELLNASQAMFFRTKKTAPFLSAILSGFQSVIPKLTEDRVLHDDIQKAIKFIQTLELENDVLFD
jgi:histidine ammonia-lyase